MSYFDTDRESRIRADTAQALLDLDAIETMKIMEFVDFRKMKYFNKLRKQLTEQLATIEKAFLDDFSIKKEKAK